MPPIRVTPPAPGCSIRARAIGRLNCSRPLVSRSTRSPIRPADECRRATIGFEWARRVGLRAGIPIAVGATDTAAELVSVGAVEPGDAIVKIASTGTVVVVADRPRPDPRYMTYPSAIDGRWYAMPRRAAVTSDTWLRASVLAARYA